MIFSGGGGCSGIKQEGQVLHTLKPLSSWLLAALPNPECGVLSPPGGRSGHCIGRLDPAAWGRGDPGRRSPCAEANEPAGGLGDFPAGAEVERRSEGGASGTAA